MAGYASHHSQRLRCRQLGDLDFDASSQREILQISIIYCTLGQFTKQIFPLFLVENLKQKCKTLIG